MGVFITDKDGKLKKVAGNSGIGLPVGTIFSSAIPLTDARVHLLDGSTISQTGVYKQFADLIKSLVSSGYNVVYETNKQFDDDVTATGNCGKFVIDDNAGTIRLPKITTFIQGLSSITNIGDSLSAGLPNITGQVGGMGNRFFVNENSGAFSNNTDKANSANTIGPTGQSYSAQTYYGAKFDANAGADVKGIYGNSNTVQPNATQFPYYIVLANGYKSTEAVNFDNIVSELNNKQDKLTAGNGINIANGVISAISIKELWRNPNTNIDFPSQNITLNSSDYDFLLVIYAAGKSSEIIYEKSVISQKGNNATLSDVAALSSTPYARVGYRDCNYISDISYGFGDAVFALASSSYFTLNSKIIPKIIYGIKVV